MKAWLKGGIIALAIYLVSYAAAHFDILPFFGIFAVQLGTALKFTMVSLIGLSCGVKCRLWTGGISVLLSLIISFAVGVLIGKIVEKIKSK